MLMSRTMPKNGSSLRASIPSVDRLLRADALREAAERHGRTLVVESAREVLDEVRGAIGTGAGTDPGTVEASALAARIAARADDGGGAVAEARLQPDRHRAPHQSRAGEPRARRRSRRSSRRRRGPPRWNTMSGGPDAATGMPMSKGCSAG